MCSKCYYRVKRGGTPEMSKKQQQALRTCSVDNCKGAHVANNYCAKHNRRLLRHGDALFINPKCNRDGLAKQRAREYRAQWKRDNWGTYKAYLQARKQRVKQAAPKWANLAAIEKLYRECPKGCHVDHIIPLRGINVSGLHVEDNLQYLPALDNLKKSNKT